MARTKRDGPRLRARRGAYDGFFRAFAESGEYIVQAHPSSEFPEGHSPNAVFEGLARAHRRFGPSSIVVQQSRHGIILRNRAAEHPVGVPRQLQPPGTERESQLASFVLELEITAQLENEIQEQWTWEAYMEHALRDLGPTRSYPSGADPPSG
jgi:hypothetical protein